VLKLTYDYKQGQEDENSGWTCDDGFVEDPDGNLPQIDVYNKTKLDSFTMDTAQDCIVDQKNSSVTVSANGFASFKVHFIRKLKTRGEENDAVLEIGKSINMEHYYSMTNNGKAVEDKHRWGSSVSLNILTGASKLVASVLVLASLI